MARKDQYDVTVSIDGKPFGGPNHNTFDSMTGGEVDSDELKYKPGGMAAQVSLGGSVTVGQVVVARLYELKRDHPLVHTLLTRVGKATMVIHKQPLDDNGHAFGKPLVYKGVLKRVTPPEVDSTSTDPALIELEMTPEGTVT